MFKKVKRKILVINILIISILLFVAMTAIYLFTLKTIYSEIKKDVEQVHYEWNEIDEMLKKSNNEAIGDRLAEALIKTEELGSLPWTLRISVLAKIDNKTGERNIYSVHDNDPDILDYAISKTDISDGDIVFFRHKDKEWAGYKQNLKESTKYIFIDTTSRMIYLKELMITSGIIFSATLVIVFLISIYLTNRAVQPVDLAFKKQIQFISDASHELRTPLASIRANADLILKRKKNQLGVDVKWLEYIKDETKRMTALTNEMLYLAELEDKYRLNDARRRFDIGKDINNHILGMEAMAYEKSITLKHNIDSRIDVYGNREKLNQVVIILMNNASYVSNTLEYAFDDWCLAQAAKVLKKNNDYKLFMERSRNWRNIFDSESRFMRPKNADGTWHELFNPYHTPGFVEGNSWQFSWFVPHDIDGLVKAIGKKRFISRLDSAMQQSQKVNFNALGDNFSRYPINHGNQPNMQSCYLFNYAGASWLTQKWARAIQEKYYGTGPRSAYPGDEDQGQMSAWYVMSTIGLFQMDGGASIDPYYELGSPRFEKITIHLSDKYYGGKTFVIEAKNASRENKYIHSAILNGKKLNSWSFSQSELGKGGELILDMKNIPNKSD